MLDVSASNGSSSTLLSMIVDSGAQHTLVHANFAQALGIDLARCPRRKVGGITGAGEGYVHPVRIQVLKMKEIITVDAIFLPDLGTTGLLGQLDFFERFSVRFEKRELAFYLREVPALQF